MTSIFKKLPIDLKHKITDHFIQDNKSALALDIKISFDNDFTKCSSCNQVLFHKWGNKVTNHRYDMTEEYPIDYSSCGSINDLLDWNGGKVTWCCEPCIYYKILNGNLNFNLQNENDINDSDSVHSYESNFSY